MHNPANNYRLSVIATQVEFCLSSHFLLHCIKEIFLIINLNFNNISLKTSRLFRFIYVKLQYFMVNLYYFNTEGILPKSFTDETVNHQKETLALPLGSNPWPAACEGEATAMSYQDEHFDFILQRRTGKHLFVLYKTTLLSPRTSTALDN